MSSCRARDFPDGGTKVIDGGSAFMEGWGGD